MTAKADIPSDEELVELAKSGDRQSFGTLVLRYQDSVYNLACRTLGDRNRACDAAQDAFLRAWRSIAAFKGESKFSSWIYRITVNCCLSHLRRRGVAFDAEPPDVMERMQNPASPPEHFSRTVENQDLVENLLKQLPPIYRTLVTLHYLQGIDCREVADITGCPLGTVKAYLHRARALMRRLADQWHST
jgi:RNA polymerase sigma-70 factor (ECF subfamily)